MSEAAPAQRIIGLDVARALAILGMILVNYKLVLVGFRGGDSATGWWAAQCAGRAGALFVVLAGIGISLLTARAREGGENGRARLRVLRRALFLLVVGFAFFPLWEADILHYYGVYLAFAALALTAPTLVLWALVPVAIGGFVALDTWLEYNTGWSWRRLEYVDFWSVDGFTRNLFFSGFHPLLPWLAFLFAGMAIGRIDFTSRRNRLILLSAGAAVFGLAMWTSDWLREMSSEYPRGDDMQRELRRYAGTSSIPPMPLYVLQAGGMATAVIGLCLELGTLLGSRILWPLIATGQLALTLYLAHVVIGLGLIEEIWGSFETTRYGVEFALEATLWFFAGSVVFAMLWRRFFKRGPLEAVMRWIAP